MEETTWKKSGSCITERYAAASAIVKKGRTPVGILIAGGRNDASTSLASVEFFEAFISDCWWPLPSLNTARQSCFAASLMKPDASTTVYCIGGYSSTRQLNSVECWTIGSEQWQVVEPMKACRSHGAAVGLAHCQTIIVCGGKDETWTELNSAEAYDVKLKRWYDLAPMKHARYGCTTVAIGATTVMVIGGHSGSKYLRSTEIYSVDTMKWTDAPDMPHCCAFHASACIVQEGRFVVVTGGRNDDGILSDTICFDVKHQTWSALPSLCSAREKGAAEVIDKRIVLVGGNGATGPVKQVDTLYLTDSLRSELSSRNSQSTARHPPLASADMDDQQPAAIRRHLSAESSNLGVTVITNAILVPACQDETSVLTSDIQNQTATVAVRNDATPLAAVIAEDLVDVVELLMVDTNGEDARFTGTVLESDRRPHGQGRMVCDYDGSVYNGSWRNGLRHGQGQQTRNGEVYEGTFESDRKAGRGVLRWQDGSQYDGEFRNNKQHGVGTLHWPDQTTYVGEFRHGKREGQGKSVFPTGFEYNGTFAAGKFHGFGTGKFADGKIYEGEWAENKAHGDGTLCDKHGNVVHTGKWHDDQHVSICP